MSRAAGLAMVAYDTNALDSQLLQGWLMRDRFMMRGSLGAVYEFLWANPYQPGLNYDQVPLVFHEPYTGEVFARTSWDEDATWIGYFEGRLQLFQNGRLQTLRAGRGGQSGPGRNGDHHQRAARDAAKFRVRTAMRRCSSWDWPPDPSTPWKSTTRSWSSWIPTPAARSGCLLPAAPTWECGSGSGMR